MRLKRIRDSETSHTMQNLYVFVQNNGDKSDSSGGGIVGSVTNHQTQNLNNGTISAARHDGVHHQQKPHHQRQEQQHQRQLHRKGEGTNNNKLSYNNNNNNNNSGGLISNIYSSWWWLYCCCYLCLLSNYASFAVNGAYPDTDELINELDRPSK